MDMFRGNPLSLADPMGLADGLPFNSGFLSPYPAPGQGLIMCDGDGGIRIEIGSHSWDKIKCGVVGCVYRHEFRHCSDARRENPQVCVGGLFRETINWGELLPETEANAHSDSVACLVEMRELMPECGALLDTEIRENEHFRDDYLREAMREARR